MYLFVVYIKLHFCFRNQPFVCVLLKIITVFFHPQVRLSGFLDLVEKGDSFAADKGVLIAAELAARPLREN